MKKYLISGLLFLLLIIGGSFWILPKESCLFHFKGKCYTCEESGEFWVGLPENCNICPNRHAQYYGDDLFPVWDCLPQKPDEEVVPNLSAPEINPNIQCSKETPLKDILGHCYPCSTNQPVRLMNNNDKTCPGKRYLTEHRLSEKSRKCPPKKEITNPEICQECQGFWYDESCHHFKWKETAYCTVNEECSLDEFCFPFRYQKRGKTGICRPKPKTRWICSDTDGYNNASAHLFCTRQGAHIPTLEALNTQKEEAFQACADKEIWVFFDEGSLYFKSLEMEFLFTREGMEKDYGGDNFYALCQLD